MDTGLVEFEGLVRLAISVGVADCPKGLRKVGATGKPFPGDSAGLSGKGFETRQETAFSRQSSFGENGYEDKIR